MADGIDFRSDALERSDPLYARSDALRWWAVVLGALLSELQLASLSCDVRQTSELPTAAGRAAAAAAAAAAVLRSFLKHVVYVSRLLSLGSW